MSYRLSYGSHVASAHEAATALGLQATLGLGDQILELRGRDRQFRLYPQFIVVGPQGGPAYSPRPTQRTGGLIGWLPYFNKRWPLGFDKIAFKDYCLTADLRTPQTWRSPADDMRDFIVKRSQSSYSAGQRGPFASRQAAEAAVAFGHGTYCEAFIRGRILKAYYWNEHLAAVEMLDMPALTGDGTSTLRELIARTLGPRASIDPQAPFAEIAAYSGLKLDDVPAKGRCVLIDYRFGSPFHQWPEGNSNSLPKLKGSALERQLTDFGRALRLGIPEEQREGTLFSVDAIADDNDQVWLLEMNCNPLCHPDVYPFMFEWLFTSPKAVQGAAPTPRQIPAPPPIPAFAGPALWRVS